MRPTILILLLTICLFPSLVRAEGTPAPAQPVAAEVSSTATTPAEAELGKETAKEIEKEYKLIHDEKAIARLNSLTAAIAPNTQRPDVVYTCKILDVSALNAMAIPGGTIYVTRGLLNAVESDDELAGVLAHEIAHNSLYHIKKLIEREKKGSITQAIALAAAIFAKNNSGNADSISSVQLFMLSQYIKQALVNGYTIELETEADANGLQYLVKGKKYDPVGFYSVLLGFRQQEREQPEMDFGFLKNHPDTETRITAVRKALAEQDIPINVWNVVKFRAQVLPPAEGKTGYTVQLGSANLLTFTAADGDKDAQARARAAVEAINACLTQSAAQIESFEVTAMMSPDGTQARIRMRNTTVMTLIPADIPNGQGTLSDLATAVKQSMQTVMYNEKVKRGI